MRILHIRPGSHNGIKYSIFPCPIYISSSDTAGAARQVATLAVLVSQHAVVTQSAVVALQQEEQPKEGSSSRCCCSAARRTTERRQ